MSSQQNFCIDSEDRKTAECPPVINKIDSEAMRFRTLVAQLRMNKKRSAYDPLFNGQSELEISNIEHRSENFEKNSFQLELPTDLTVKKNGFTTSPITFKDREGSKDVGDRGLKYKPRSSVNGRDDIRIRNLNGAHKKIVEQLEKRRNQSQDIKVKETSIIDYENQLERMMNPEVQVPQKNNVNNNKFRRSRITQFTPSIKEQVSNRQSPQSHHKKASFYTERNSRVNQHHHLSGHNDNFLEIEGKQLLEYLLRLFDQSYPSSESSPNQIYTFFVNICQSFGVHQYFHQPLIKRYRNCVYFGEKIPPNNNGNNNKNYMGFVWYYRKALYYGQFSRGRKHGYGVQVDLQESGAQTIWKGNFQQGKKTGYFQMSNPQMEYNGSMINSYFDGEGQLTVIGKSTYKGTFQAGMKQGYGVETFLNNKSLTYKGHYVDNKFDGNGILEGPNYHYKGSFRSGKPHGDGFERTDEFEYIGQFKNGKRNGRGTLKMKTGEVYEGLFEDGRIMGQQSSNYQYVKNIPIQSFSKNHHDPSLPSLSPSRQLPESTSLKLQYSNPSPQRSNKTTASPRIDHHQNNSSNRMRLSKYLSKNLAALDEQNEEGTLQPSDPYLHSNNRGHARNHKNQQIYTGNLKLHQIQKAQRWATRGQEDDQDDPLETRVVNHH